MTPLGTFHPHMAAHVGGLLDGRGIAHQATPADDGGGTTVLVDPNWRDEVRSELVLRWGDLVASLPEDEVVEVLASGGAAPGWYDPPRGGYVDRAGRLVVDPGEDEEAAVDAARIIGPVALTVGLILIASGWYVFDATAVALVGLALVVFGLFTPR